MGKRSKTQSETNELECFRDKKSKIKKSEIEPVDEIKQNLKVKKTNKRKDVTMQGISEIKPDGDFEEVKVKKVKKRKHEAKLIESDFKPRKDSQEKVKVKKDKIRKDVTKPADTELKTDDHNNEKEVKVKKVKNHKDVVEPIRTESKTGDNRVELKKKKIIKNKDVTKLVGNEKAKKTIVVDDVLQEVPAISGTANDKGNNNSKKFLNADEAEVRDEDIDKFVDELDDEDNAQFEDWVKLIEANMHSNKKKSN